MGAKMMKQDSVGMDTNWLSAIYKALNDFGKRGTMSNETAIKLGMPHLAPQQTSSQNIIPEADDLIEPANVKVIESGYQYGMDDKSIPVISEADDLIEPANVKVIESGYKYGMDGRNSPDLIVKKTGVKRKPKASVRRKPRIVKATKVAVDPIDIMADTSAIKPRVVTAAAPRKVLPQEALMMQYAGRGSAPVSRNNNAAPVIVKSAGRRPKLTKEEDRILSMF